jgi:thioredoxin 1
MKILLLTTFLLIAVVASLTSAKILKLTTENFNQTVYRTDKKTLVNFYAPWDGQSKRMMKSFKELAASDYVVKDHPELELAKVDVTKYPELAEQQGIEQWPTLMLYKDGRLKGREYTGSKLLEHLIRHLNTFLDFDEEKHEREKAEREEEQRIAREEAARLREELKESEQEAPVNEEADEK